MFLDASAIVAILAQEPESNALTEKLEAAPSCMTSPLSRYEAVLALRRIYNVDSVEGPMSAINDFLELYDVRIVDVTPEIGVRAIAAFDRFGKGRHKASLNMGDCFSYAYARLHRVPLLCKGDDFRHTDIKIA